MPKNKLIQIKVEDEFHALVLKAATEDRRSVSQFVRLSIEERISRLQSLADYIEKGLKQAESSK